MYLTLAVTLATWYNKGKSAQQIERRQAFHRFKSRSDLRS